VLFASNLGAAGDPAWYRNLVAHPDVTVEVGGERIAGRAATASGAERQRLFDAWVARFPSTAEHRTRTAREIPMVIVRIEDADTSAAP